MKGKLRRGIFLIISYLYRDTLHRTLTSTPIPCGYSSNILVWSSTFYFFLSPLDVGLNASARIPNFIVLLPLISPTLLICSFSKDSSLVSGEKSSPGEANRAYIGTLKSGASDNLAIDREVNKCKFCLHMCTSFHGYNLRENRTCVVYEMTDSWCFLTNAIAHKQ